MNFQLVIIVNMYDIDDNYCGERIILCLHTVKTRAVRCKRRKKTRRKTLR